MMDKMRKQRLKQVLTKEQKRQNLIRIGILIAYIASCIIIFVQTIYDLSIEARYISNLMLLGLFVLMLFELLVRIKKIHDEEGRDGLIDYLKFNQFEVIYFVVSIIVLPLSFVSNTFWIKLLKWVALLKMQSVTRPFKDESVFEVIVNLVFFVLVCFFMVPFLNVVSTAFSSPPHVINVLPKGLSLFSLDFVLHDPGIFRAIAVSFFVTTVGTLLSVFCMIMAAYPLSKKDMPLRKTMMIFFLIVMLFSGGMAPNIMVVNSLGLLDTVWALIFPSVVIVFHLLLLKGAFEDIPAEIEESAKLDGANNYVVLFKIIAPMAVPMIATVVMFTAISYWNNLNNSILYIVGDTSLYPLPMFIKNVLGRNPNDIAMQNEMALAYWDNIKMAYILVSIIPIFCLYPLILKHFTKDTTSGAVKG